MCGMIVGRSFAFFVIMIAILGGGKSRMAIGEYGDSLILGSCDPLLSSLFATLLFIFFEMPIVRELASFGSAEPEEESSSEEESDDEVAVSGLEKFHYNCRVTFHNLGDGLVPRFISNKEIVEKLADTLRVDGGVLLSRNPIAVNPEDDPDRVLDNTLDSMFGDMFDKLIGMVPNDNMMKAFLAPQFKKNAVELDRALGEEAHDKWSKKCKAQLELMGDDRVLYTITWVPEADRLEATKSSDERE